MKKGKYVSVRRKVQRIVLNVAVVALLLDSIVGLAALNRMQNLALQSEEELAVYASGEGERAVKSQNEQSMRDLADCKAKLVQGNLKEYTSYMDALVFCAEGLYSSNAAYGTKEVLPPDKKNKGKPVMQRCLRDKSVKYASVKEQIGRMGNMEVIFSSIFGKNEDVVSTIYVVTESGFMLSYDDNSDIMDKSDGEEYYDYSKTDWYRLAGEKDGVSFSDTYIDAFGRGLTVTCVAPFHDRTGAFAGAVCMDLLVNDLNDNITNINMGESSYVLLLDQYGNVIASPKMDKTSDKFENIVTDEKSKGHEAAETIMSGEKGVTLTSAGIYYAYAPVAMTGWTVVIHVDQSEVTEPITQIHETIEKNTAQVQQDMKDHIFRVNMVFIGNLILMCIAVLFGARLFAKRLTRPIILMKEAVQNIDGGNVDLRVEVESRDEIGDLAEAFNHLHDSLKKYIDELTKMTAEKERISAELDVATRIQADMLPSIFPPFPDREEFNLYASMNPAKEVGGDFYDFFMVDENHLALVMADVSGKGVPAALFMVIAKTLLKNAAQQGLSPKDTLEKVNQQLCENNKEEMFVTVWIGILDISSGMMECANAGHEFPAIRRAGGQFELFKDKHGIVLAGFEGSKYKQYELQLRPGDMIFVYTDGVPEATNAREELFGTERMLEALNHVKDEREILNTVWEEVNEYVGDAPQFDDLTMLALAYKGIQGEKGEC